MINRKALILIFIVSLTAFTAGGCAHYKANPFLKGVSPESGYRLKNLAQSERSDQLILVLAFSGGGTRAASLAYGVLEELAETKILLEG